MRNTINSINDVMDNLIASNIAHLCTDNERIHSKFLNQNGEKVINFSSSSYFGLEFDKRLIDGAIHAIRTYGTQFSVSKSNTPCCLYAELEERLNKLFNAYCVVTPTTTLGHISTISNIIDREDLVIVDHQVHASVQTAVQLLKSKGTKVEIIKHNRMDLLEERLLLLKGQYKKVWYIAEGIYSMNGDKAPLNEINQLLNKYPEFHFYVDDAHGMSCYGSNGQGFVLSNQTLHNKMVLVTSLDKAFTTGGGVIVFPNKEIAQKVKDSGVAMLKSDPIQPSDLGAAIACADIHLSNNLIRLQERLQENIKYANKVFQSLEIPLITVNDSPIFFVGVGLPKVGFNLVKRILNEGMFTNIGIYPAVPMENTGVRFLITKLHTFKQIEKLAEAFAYHLPLAMKEENYSIKEMQKAFGMEPSMNKLTNSVRSLINISKLDILHQKTIYEVDQIEWNNIFKGKGTFDWEGIELLEKTFQNNSKIENNWVFDYITIKEAETGRVILKTFSTVALYKDDIFADRETSNQIEITRKTSPYFLTSKVVSLGSQLTFGEHLFVDFDSEIHQEALEMLLITLTKIQKRENATSILLRDFSNVSEKIQNCFIKNGYVKTQVLDHYVNETPTSGNQLAKPFAKNYGNSFQKNVIGNKDDYRISLVKESTANEIEKWYQLYLNAKNLKSQLNTFQLPFKLFKEIATSDNWEIYEMKHYDNDTKTIGVVFNYKNAKMYNMIAIGLDTDHINFSMHEQKFYQSIQKTEELGYENIINGFTTSFEKRKFGIQQLPSYAFLQTDDNCNSELTDIKANHKQVKQK